MTRRKQNRYWEERAAAERKWQEEQLKGDADFAKILNRPYQVAADEINKEIAEKRPRSAAFRTWSSRKTWPNMSA